MANPPNGSASGTDLQAPGARSLIQNIPLRTEIGRRLRKVFTEDAPRLDLDYASLETRLGACVGLKAGELISAELLFGGSFRGPLARRPDMKPKTSSPVPKCET